VKLDKLNSLLNSSKLKELGVKKIALYLVVLCVTVISIIVITITHKSSDISKLVTEAEEHFFAQEYDLAIGKYSELTKIDALSPKWDIKISEIYSIKNDLNNSYDDYTKKIIVENYDKAQKLKESYTKGKDNQELKIPEFTLFY